MEFKTFMSSKADNRTRQQTNEYNGKTRRSPFGSGSITITKIILSIRQDIRRLIPEIQGKVTVAAPCAACRYRHYFMKPTSREITGKVVTKKEDKTAVIVFLMVKKRMDVGVGGEGGGWDDVDKYNTATTTHRVQPSFTTTLALLLIGSGGEGAGHDGGDVR